jgi:plasmid maintenance system antidote protein VapI
MTNKDENMDKLLDRIYFPIVSILGLIVEEKDRLSPEIIVKLNLIVDKTLESWMALNTELETPEKEE